MKNTYINSALILSLGLFGLVACTDKREPEVVPPTPLCCAVEPEVLEAISRVEYPVAGSRTEAQQMHVAGGALIVSGKPFGFSQWDLLSNPEHPVKISAMSENINLFSDPSTPWLPDYYASGAIQSMGRYVITSGQAGASVIDTADPARPREVRRYPQMVPVSGNNVAVPTFPEDARFQYKAMAKHPTLPIVYGFRQQDKVYRLSMNGPDLALQTMQDYITGGTMCCVMGAANFQNKIFVAFRSHMYVYTPQADGTLGNAQMITSLQAVNVQATSRFLYVHHQPSAADPVTQQLPAGIYVFDASGNNLAYLPIDPLRFAVSPTDSHIYANEDNASVMIYKILWTNL